MKIRLKFNKVRTIKTTNSIYLCIICIFISSGCMNYTAIKNSQMTESSSININGDLSSNSITQDLSSGITQNSSNVSSNIIAPTKMPAISKAPTVSPIPTISPTPEIPKDIAKTIKIGQYLTLGKYYNEPIIWRCVDINENGPLMLSDKILTIKPFDGGATHKYLDGTTQPDDVNSRRKVYGSNIWATSDIRSWLNSSMDAGKVKWLDGSAPIASSLRNNINAYDKEKGFLAKGNFTTYEISFIKQVEQKSILSDVDAQKHATGGTEALKGISYTTGLDFPDVTKALLNYDSAYYHMVSDKVFILDIKDINKIYENKKILGEDYYIGKPTKKLIENTKYSDPRLLTPEKNWHSYTRTPQAENGYSILLVISMKGPYQKAGVFYDNANDFYIGIRPAFYLQ